MTRGELFLIDLLMYTCVLPVAPHEAIAIQKASPHRDGVNHSRRLRRLWNSQSPFADDPHARDHHANGSSATRDAVGMGAAHGLAFHQPTRSRRGIPGPHHQT